MDVNFRKSWVFLSCLAAISDILVGEWTPTKLMPLTHETHKPPGLMVIPGTNVSHLSRCEKPGTLHPVGFGPTSWVFLTQWFYRWTMDDFGELSCTSSPQVRCLTFGPVLGSTPRCLTKLKLAATSDSHWTNSSTAATLVWFPYLESRNHVPCFGARWIHFL